MKNHLVKVAEFNNSHSAQLMKNLLENNLIFAKLDGEHTNDRLPVPFNTIHLNVFQNDLSQALSILKQYHQEFNFSILTDIA